MIYSVGNYVDNYKQIEDYQKSSYDKKNKNAMKNIKYVKTILLIKLKQIEQFVKKWFFQTKLKNSFILQKKINDKHNIFKQ